MPRALILDLDGVIIDSEPLWREAGVRLFRSLGVPMTVQRMTETMGMRIDQDVAYWYERYPWPGPSLEEVGARWIADVTELVRQRSEAEPGLHRVVEMARSLGWRIGVASSSPLDYVQAAVEKAGIAHAVEAVCSADSEPYGKPHPGVFITTAKRLGVDPEDCVVIEDSPNGVIAARAARMRCIAIPDPLMAGRPEFALAAAVVQSLEEVTMGMLTGEGEQPPGRSVPPTP